MDLKPPHHTYKIVKYEKKTNFPPNFRFCLKIAQYISNMVNTTDNNSSPFLYM